MDLALGGARRLGHQGSVAVEEHHAGAAEDERQRRAAALQAATQDRDRLALPP
jgi:hypothetical protein